MSVLESTVTVVDSMFGLAEKLFASQRQFATALVTSVSSSCFGSGDGSRGASARVLQAGGTPGSHLSPLRHSSLQLEVDRVLDPAAALPHFFAGHSPTGQRYLIVQTTGDAQSGTWMCAPITERALDCVVAGRAELRDALVHTATGGVEIITLDSKGNRTEAAMLCRDVDDAALADLPALGDKVPLDPVAAEPDSR